MGKKVLKEIIFQLSLEKMSTDLLYVWSLGSLFHNFWPIVLKLVSEKVLFIINGTT
jgi:hypothetical protein